MGLTITPTPSAASDLSDGTTGSGSIVLATTPTITTPVLTGLPTGSGVASGATVSTLASRDSSGNLSSNASIDGYTTTVTANQTTTLTVASTKQQYFTGTTANQIVALPVTSTLVLGQEFEIVNASTQAISVLSSGGNTITWLQPNSSGRFICILTSGTTAASWNAITENYGSTNTGATASLLALPPVVTIYTKSVSLLTTGSPADLATVIVPLWITRYRVIGGSALYSMGAIITETQSGTPAAATIAVRTSANGGGTTIYDATACANGANTAAGWVASSSALYTAATLYIRQTVNSANAATVSFYIALVPYP